jgi:hypothetical protein
LRKHHFVLLLLKYAFTTFRRRAIEYTTNLWPSSVVLYLRIVQQQKYSWVLVLQEH